MTYHLTPSLSVVKCRRSSTEMKLTKAYPTLQPSWPVVSYYLYKSSRRSRLTVLEIHSQIHKVDSPRTDLGNEGHQVLVAHLIRNVFDHHRSPRVQSLFNPFQIELILLRDRRWWNARRPDMEGRRGLMQLLVQVTGGNRGFGWGVLIAGGWSGKCRRKGAEQGGRAMMV